MKPYYRRAIGVLLAVCLLVVSTMTGAFALGTSGAAAAGSVNAKSAGAKTAAAQTSAVKTAESTAAVAGLDLNALTEKFNDTFEDVGTGDLAGDVGKLLQDANIYNLLVVGVDSRLNDYEGRSDAMLLLSINNTSKKLVMASLLRDSYVSIPGQGNNRLNAAYQFGGISLLKKTIRQNYDIKVDAYAVVNFNDVIDFINDIGGIDMDVTSAEIKYMNQYTSDQNKELYGNASNPDAITAKAGTMKLNGMQALAYARVRYVGQDFGRTARQRKVISASLKQLFRLPVTTQVKLIAKYMERVQTDLTVPELLYLMLVYATLDSYETTSIALPVDGTYQSVRAKGMDVLKVDFEANKAAWKAAVG